MLQSAGQTFWMSRLVIQASGQERSLSFCAHQAVAQLPKSVNAQTIIERLRLSSSMANITMGSDDTEVRVNIKGSTDQPIYAILPCPANIAATQYYDFYIDNAKLVGFDSLIGTGLLPNLPVAPGAHVVYNAMSREKYYTSGASGKYGYELYAEVAVS
ncbi:hypothetical protein PSTT_09535 [Puccinia striiformis]|uniref:Uncharacterized protein n=1 Tax=Puccinia striiformis TaxID=27350 RepID=A0A2S4V8E3_9BASI|nr:hypothetical protein PSTT_09535 [Puccinia striiformis]